jgi:DedD protein
MSDLNQPAATTPEDDEEALKKRILGRVAIAGIVVVALLGGLAVFEALYVEQQPKRVAAAPPAAAPVEAAKDTSKEAPPAEGVKEAPKEDAPGTTAEPAKAVVAEPTRAPEPEATPEHTGAAQGRPTRALTPPATARPAMVKPSEALVAAREVARAPATASPGPLSQPLGQTVPSARRFVLQMGVFNNVANAEELRARLELNGIPAQIEARVQVGPFATREEADAARAKLRALGLEGGILTATRK